MLLQSFQNDVQNAIDGTI